MRLQGKIAVITGASMGIGEAIAKLFVAEGAQVVLSSRDLSRVEEARQRIGHAERTLAVACDVSQRADLEKLLQAALQRFGRVDIWVNNAGFGLIDSVAAMDMEQCRRLFATNVFGAVEAMQLVAPVMSRQGSGAIINIASVAGHIAVPYSATYSASKSALIAFGRAMRIELLGSGVNVLTVCPGYIATDFAANALKGRERKRLGMAARRGISVERCARAVLRGYLRGSRQVVVPFKDHFVIWLYRLLPGVVDRMMHRMLRPADQVIAEAEAARRAGRD